MSGNVVSMQTDDSPAINNQIIEILNKLDKAKIIGRNVNIVISPLISYYTSISKKIDHILQTYDDDDVDINPYLFSDIFKEDFPQVEKNEENSDNIIKLCAYKVYGVQFYKILNSTLNKAKENISLPDCNKLNHYRRFNFIRRFTNKTKDAVAKATCEKNNNPNKVKLDKLTRLQSTAKRNEYQFIDNIDKQIKQFYDKQRQKERQKEQQKEQQKKQLQKEREATNKAVLSWQNELADQFDKLSSLHNELTECEQKLPKQLGGDVDSDSNVEPSIVIFNNVESIKDLITKYVTETNNIDIDAAITSALLQDSTNADVMGIASVLSKSDQSDKLLQQINGHFTDAIAKINCDSLNKNRWFNNIRNFTNKTNDTLAMNKCKLHKALLEYYSKHINDTFLKFKKDKNPDYELHLRDYLNLNIQSNSDEQKKKEQKDQFNTNIQALQEKIKECKQKLLFNSAGDTIVSSDGNELPSGGNSRRNKSKSNRRKGRTSKSRKKNRRNKSKRKINRER